jgi:hypothetical protein
VNTTEIEDAYANWIDAYHWQWFATLTFRGYASVSNTNRRFKSWIDAVEKGTGTGTFRWVRVIERYPSNHLHVLVGGIADSRGEKWIELWENLAGDARIEPFDPDLNGIRYMLKTLEADAALDIDFHFSRGFMLGKGHSK